MISGMQTVQPDPDDASALAAQLAEALEVSIRNHHSMQVIGRGGGGDGGSLPMTLGRQPHVSAVSTIIITA